MCGIAGSVNFPFSGDVVNKVMGHRGPDERQSFREGAVMLHHLRLAILDVAGGRQPMEYLGRYVIVFNGEIYNHLDVRSTLGLQCISNSDTETLLHAFHKVGPAMLDLLDGMFALAIYDRENAELFLARDRAGKKPLYYFNDGNKLMFASELNALRALLPLEIEEKGIYQYLRLGSFFRNRTPYQQVYELPGGHWMRIQVRNCGVTTRQWWNIGKYYQDKTLQLSEEEALNTLDLHLRTSVKRRLESSDLEVGAFLSGGIDSGLVTAHAAMLHPGVQTFTISFDGTFDEAPLARLVADRYNTRHHEISIGFDDLPDNVIRILGQYGEPFYDSSAIPSWYVSKAASAHLTVILNGDGADELFGGYRRYVPFSRINFFRQPPLMRKLVAAACAILPPSDNKKSTYNYIYRLAALASAKGVKTFIGATSDIVEGFESHLTAPPESYMKDVDDYFGGIIDQPLSGLQQLLWLDFDITLLDDFLVKMDIATMAHSLEGRSPMLGKELLEWVPRLPDHMKIKGKTTKYLLRKLAGRYLPPALLNQPKRGFEVPLKEWVNGVLQPVIQDYLMQAGALYPAFIERKFVLDVLGNKIRMSAEKRAKLLWTLTALEVWYRHQAILSTPASSNSLS